ncbi:MAG: hypothetical protein AAF697_09410 [Pseudomonadota bacterium]
MKYRAIISVTALACAGSASLAQDADPATEAQAELAETPTTTVEEGRVRAAEDGITTWHALIAISQVRGPRSCDTQTFKVSTADPITFEGPETLTAYHADELVEQWMHYLHDNSPRAWRWFNGPNGYASPQVYFRNTAEDAIEAFRADGHLRRDRACFREVLVKHATANFDFEPPVSFAESDFGLVEDTSDAVVVRELDKIPGVE